MSVLKDDEIKEVLKSLPGWSRSGNAIERSYEFKDFLAALAFVNQVAKAAESANHHPDIDIRYNKVKLVLTSHDAGGVTQRDVKMAKTISELK